MKSTAGTLKKPSGSSKEPKAKEIALWRDLKAAFALDRESLAGLKALYHKEMMDNIRSRRFIMILAVIIVTSYASLYGALSGMSSDSDYIFLSPDAVDCLESCEVDKSPRAGSKPSDHTVLKAILK